MEQKINFCTNCGAQLHGNEKFCHACGALITNEFSDKTTKREQEFAGKIIKCPACGEELPSFTAICPACGHEINSATLSSTIKDFAEKINKCDTAIANRPAERKSGWQSWSDSRKVGWVILNFITLGFPFLIYYLLPYLGLGRSPVLTAEEKNKEQLISNYLFPNDREHILEALLFIKSQIHSLAAGKKDRSTYRWIEIWKGKAKHLYEKAEILFKDDIIANETYNSILADEKNVKNALIKRVVSAVIICAIFIILYLMFIIIGYKSTEGELYGATGVTETNIKNYVFNIPVYWSEMGSENNNLQFQAENSEIISKDSILKLIISYPEENDKNYEVNFDGLYADNENVMKAICDNFTDGDIIDYQIFESEANIKGILYHFSFNQKKGWFDKINGGGYCFCFPSESDRRWFFVTLLYSYDIDIDDYKEDYMDLIYSIREKSSLQ